MNEPTGTGIDSILGDQGRPNIVVVMADDMRKDDLQYLPRTRALIGGEQGVRFANALSQHPQCCPARASFLTGQYTHNHKVWTNRGDYGGFAALDDSDTLAVRLSRAGYNTAFLGKYLNGYGVANPGDEPGPNTYIPPGWSDWRAVAAGVYRYLDSALNINGTIRPTHGWYQTRMLGAEARDMITTHARSPRPFFLWTAFLPPHVGGPREPDDPEPVEQPDGTVDQFVTPAVPKGVRDMYDETVLAPPGDEGETDVSDKPYFVSRLRPPTEIERAAMTEVTRQRAESLEVLDQEIEGMVEALEQTDELDETVFVFTADNGYFLGEHRIRQGKLLPYDPALRVPLLVRGPGLPSGEVRKDPVLMLDFAPTFLKLAGADPVRGMDGSSFLDLDAPADPTADTGWERAVLTETGPRRRATREHFEPLPPGADELRFTQGLRTRRYLYVEHATGERELYDQRRDPAQLENIVERQSTAPVVAAMAELLEQMRECAGAQCRVPAPRMLQR